MESAIDRLESALTVRSQENKNATERFANELANARDEISRLKTANQAVTRRLDATIDRIRAVLGE